MLLLGMICKVGIAFMTSGALLMAQDDGADVEEQGGADVFDEVPIDGAEAPAKESGPKMEAPSQGSAAPKKDKPAAASSAPDAAKAVAPTEPDSMPPPKDENPPSSETPGEQPPAATMPQDATATGVVTQAPASPGSGVPGATAHGEGGVSPVVYALGGVGGVIGLFALYTFYRRKKTWDEISDAMKIDGGDQPMTSQPPSQFTTQDIAGISNTQVSQPISEIKD